MASVFLKLRVADFDTWKQAFDNNEPARRGATVTGHSVHRDPDDPNTAIVALRVDDLSSARAFAQSDELRRFQQDAGVQGPPEIWYTEDVDQKSY